MERLALHFGEPIPDATPIDDISGLLVKGISLRSELNRYEAENVLQAIIKYLASKPSKRKAPFSLNWVKRLHHEMLGNVWNHAGIFRTHDLNIGIPWQSIETAVHDLLENLKVWQGSFVERAALLHHRAVQIHPFRDGNGRWSRLLTNIWLRQNDQPIIDWPTSIIENASSIRAEYVAALKQFDAGNEAPLIQLQSRYMTTSSVKGGTPT